MIAEHSAFDPGYLEYSSILGYQYASFFMVRGSGVLECHYHANCDEWFTKF